MTVLVLPCDEVDGGQGRVLKLRQVLWSRMFLLRVVSIDIPSVSDLRGIPLPHLEEEYGPDAHEGRVEDSSVVVEEVLGLDHHAGVGQGPVVAELITDGAHCCVGQYTARTDVLNAKVGVISMEIKNTLVGIYSS